MSTPCDAIDPDAVPADDRGLAYGDGLFETMAATGGRVLALEAHLDRLERGCRALYFDPPDRDRLREAVTRAASGPGPSVVKLIVTRGSGGRGYEPPAEPRPRIRVSRHAWPGGVSGQRAAGVHAVRLAARLSDNPALAGIKHLNRLDQVLAARELSTRPAAEEGVVFDQAGHPVCGVMSNLFLARRGALVTPELERCGVAGIIRGVLLAHSGATGFAGISIRPVADRELDEAEEVFLTNSIRGVLPVRWLDRRDLGAPGPLALAAQRLLQGCGVLA